MSDSAKARFEKLDGDRQGVLDRARQAAELTIPSLMPPEGHSEESPLPQPYQSLGARGVNNLSSKLTLSLMPPTQPFFRNQIDEEVLEQLGASKEQAEEAMRRTENLAMREVEQKSVRTAVHMAAKHLIVTGNAMLYVPKKGHARVFRLNQYVTQRDPSGTVMEALIQEKVHPASLSEDIRNAAGLQPKDGKQVDEQVELYTHIKLVDGWHEYHQEIGGVVVPGISGRVRATESPFIPLRWVAVENEDYGRGMVEEYMGDLRSLESLSRSVIGFAAVASKIIFLLHRNSNTDEDDLHNAETGDFVNGTIDDIDVLQLEKFADFRVAKDTIDDLTLRLSHAFLLTSGTVRNAERVTAEEVRLQAQELEDVLGGVYSVLAAEMQLPLVRRLIALLKASGDFPELPKVNGRPAVEPVIITGFDALGRGHELNRVRAYFADGVNLYGEQFIMQFDPRAVAQMLSTQHNVDIAGLLKTPEQLQQEQAQDQAASLAEKAAGPVAGAVAKAATENQGE